MVAAERPGGPFDEEYDQSRYGEALGALKAAGELYKEADQASMESERFGLASAVLTIGLGATAWAVLLREQKLLRFVFAVTA